jgi:hypothetical protein
MKTKIHLQQKITQVNALIKSGKLNEVKRKELIKALGKCSHYLSVKNSKKAQKAFEEFCTLMFEALA